MHNTTPSRSPHNALHCPSYIYICRTSFRKWKLTLLTRETLRTPNSSADGILKRTLGQLYRTLVWSPLRLSEFYLHRFGLQALLPMDTHTSSLRRALKLAQEQEVAEDWEMAQKRETELDVLQALRNKGARKWRENGRARHAAQTASERQVTSQWKVPVNAELRPLRRKKRGTEVQRYCTLNEAISTQDCHTYISPFIHWYLSFHFPRETGFNDT